MLNSQTKMADVAAKNAPTKAVSKTMALQDKLPNLPIPSLEDTCKRYLRALEALQDEKEHAATKAAVEEFLANDGPKLHQALLEYARNRDRLAILFLSYSTLQTSRH